MYSYRHKTLYCLLIALFLSGCARMTLQEIKERNNHQEFSANMDYRDVYEAIYNKSRDCHGTTYENFNGVLYTDTRSGEIDWMYRYGIVLQIEIVALSGGTRVDMWSKYSNRDRSFVTIEKWAKENYQGCLYKD